MSKSKETHFLDAENRQVVSARVCVVGGGLAGCEAALTLADRGVLVTLYEMRPHTMTPVHTGGNFAELVCSNSLKSMKPESASGMLKNELDMLGSRLYTYALSARVEAGGALAVDRAAFSESVSQAIESHPFIDVVRKEAVDVEKLAETFDAVILATGPLSSDSLTASIERLVGSEMLAFFDAAAPIVITDSLDLSVLFRQNRYENSHDGLGSEFPEGDYLNAAFDKPSYESFIQSLVSAKRVITKSFETKELFQACQPIEEIARTGIDSARFGPMKPVGIVSPKTGKRPWAVVQLRPEDEEAKSYNLVGFQTNLTFSEQERIFRTIPGFENAEFARFGVMHRNTFVNAPLTLDANLALKTPAARSLAHPVYIAGQLSGTEGYCEAIRSGLHVAISVWCMLFGKKTPHLSKNTVFGALISHLSNDSTQNYQPMHVNFGIIPALENPIRNKKERYKAYASRGKDALLEYKSELSNAGFFK